jgi:hypothetical protein
MCSEFKQKEWDLRRCPLSAAVDKLCSRDEY